MIIGYERLQFKSPPELQTELADASNSCVCPEILISDPPQREPELRERRYKISKGPGSSVQTLLRTLKPFNYLEGIEMLAPQPTVNPLALLKKDSAAESTPPPIGSAKEVNP